MKIHVWIGKFIKLIQRLVERVDPNEIKHHFLTASRRASVPFVNHCIQFSDHPVAADIGSEQDDEGNADLSSFAHINFQSPSRMISNQYAFTFHFQIRSEISDKM